VKESSASSVRPWPACRKGPTPLHFERFRRALRLERGRGLAGEIIHWVRTAPNNRLERCKIKDPSLNNWPALVEAVEGNIVPDFPVINKSFNLSYSGTDR